MSEKRKISGDDTNDEEGHITSNKQPKLCEAGSSTSDYNEPVTIEMNSEYLSQDFIEKFGNAWKNEKSISDKSFELYNSPFVLATLKDFMGNKDPLLQKLMQEMTEIEYDRRQMDLYELYQSTDLANVTNFTGIQKFYKYLKETVMPWMEKLTGIKLTHLSASCSMYNTGDYLLVHDDLMSDRRIAFVYYISPWKSAEKWTDDMGGALELFENKNKEPHFPVVKKIPPINNQLAFFKVCPDSFHQVGEITTFEYPRLTINGWFHGPSEDNFVTKIPIIDLHFLSPVEKIDEKSLHKLINPVYLKDDYKKDIQKQIEEQSEASLEEFFDEDFYDQITSQIQQIPDTEWKVAGPANLRKYEILKLENTPKVIEQFLDTFKSNSFFKLLFEYTELDLWGPEKQNPKCSIELQRWTQGCYTVLGDPSQYADSTLDLIFHINAYPQVGVVTYLSPEEETLDNEIDEEEEEVDPIIVTIHPKDNVLNMVYRTEGTTKFTKYVSKNCLQEGKYSYILSCRYKE